MRPVVVRVGEVVRERLAVWPWLQVVRVGVGVMLLVVWL